MEREILSYLPDARGGDNSIFKMETDLSAEAVLLELKKAARQMPESAFLVKFISMDEEKERTPYQVKREGKDVTERLTVYDILFGVVNWNNEACFPSLLTVVKEDPDEEEVFIILKNHPKDLFNLTEQLIRKAGFNDLSLELDESYNDRFLGERW